MNTGYLPFYFKGYGIQSILLQGIWDTIHFTSRDMGYNPFYFQGYGTLSVFLPGIWDSVFNIFAHFQGYWMFRIINYCDISQFIWDACLFTSRDMGNPAYTILTC